MGIPVSAPKKTGKRKAAGWFEGEPDPKLAKVYVDLKEKGLLREDPTEQTAQEIYRELFDCKAGRMSLAITNDDSEHCKRQILAAICRVLRRH